MAPVGAVLGSVTRAAPTGLASGATIGQVVDANFLDNRQCLVCGHSFAQRPADADGSVKGSE
ncbi:hypothetical protein D3C87_358580 [compost metagenome]